MDFCSNKAIIQAGVMINRRISSICSGKPGLWSKWHVVVDPGSPESRRAATSPTTEPAMRNPFS